MFNADRTHRYLLVRRWGSGPLLPWVMLNPSKANAFVNDPTVTRVIGFARRWGYGGIAILNLFAYQATDPRELLTAPDPVGLYNDLFIAEHATGAVVAAWGTHGRLHSRDDAVARQMTAAGAALYCLGVTKDGYPKHPLARGRERVPDDARPARWTPMTPAPLSPPGGAGPAPAAGGNAAARAGKPAPRPAAWENPAGAS